MFYRQRTYELMNNGVRSSEEVHVECMVIQHVGQGGSFTAVVRRVLFHIRIRLHQSSFGLYHHYLGTPVGHGTD